MLTDETTVWRVVTASEPASTRRAARTLAALAVLGARVDDVLLDRYPRKDFPARDRRRAAGARALLEDEIEMRTRRLRASGAVARAGESVRSTRPGQPVLTCAAPVETEGRWAWRIDLPRSARPDRVGVDAGHLVVEVDGCRRWLDLPAVLRRTVALDAVRDSSGLIVRFEPDPASWPGGR